MYKRQGDLLRRGSVLIAGLLCLIPIAHPQILGMFGVETDVWDQLGAYQTGCLLYTSPRSNIKLQ